MIVFLLLWVLCVVVDGTGWYKQYRFDYSYNEASRGWFKAHKIPATWDEARVRCGLEGAVLASPLNKNMTAAIIHSMRKTRLNWECGVFTGINAQYSKGDYYSIEGVPLSRMEVNWMRSEPDNCNNSENCIALNPRGSIGDVNCTEVLPYVCYKKAGKMVPLNECGTSDPEYKLFSKTRNCYKFHTQARNWSSAFMACSAEGGYLAIPNNKEEAMHLKDLFKQNLNRTAITTKFKEVIFLGFSDKDKNGVWTTVHGARLEDNYAEWKPGQPEGKDGNTPCGVMFQTGQLGDFNCSRIVPFICEKTVNSLL